ncbi:hypothetical protein IW141_002403, partial [Coemansia sp. RSA 355]
SGWILSFHTSAAQMHVDRVLDQLQEHSNELLGSSFVVYALIYEITDWLTMTTTQIKHDVVQIDNIVMTQVPEEHTAPWLGIMGCILLAFAVGLGFTWYRNYLTC